MAILFKDPAGVTGDTPPWLVGCADVQRLGEIVSACDPLFLSPPPEKAWRPLVDGWQVALAGEAELSRLIRTRKDIEYIAVEAADGASWLAPAVLSPSGSVALSLPWGMASGGVRTRKPTAEQAGLIASAEAARAEILAGRIGEVPIDVAAEWIHCLLSSVYHLPSQAWDALELIDDRLAIRLLLASAGFPQ